MISDNERCTALTKAGSRCRNSAKVGTVYCHVHQKVAVSSLEDSTAIQPQENAVLPKSGAGPVKSGEITTEALFRELESLVEELQKQAPGFIPPSVTPAQLLEVFNRRVGQYAPESQRQALHELERNLEEVTFRDLTDLDTLKGLWYIVAYLAQSQVSSAKQGVVDRVSSLPGIATLLQLKGNLEGTSTRDLFDPQTWQGLWYILSYTARLEIDQTVQRFTESREVSEPGESSQDDV